MNTFHSYDISKLLKLFYLISPVLFYGVPVILAQNAGGNLPMFFFEMFYIDTLSFLSALACHIIFGVFLLFPSGKSSFTIRVVQVKSLAYQFLLALIYLVYLFSPIRYISALVFPVLILLLATYRPTKVGFSFLFFIASVSLFFNYDRYPIIFVGLVLLIPFLAWQSYAKLILTAIFGLFFLIFILQPLRAGMIPLLNDSGLASFSYFFRHLYPIYIGSFVSLELNLDFESLISEALPLFKGVFRVDSVIDVVDDVAMPFDAPARLGSNSTMYFSVVGVTIVGVLLFICRSFIFFLGRYELKNAFLLLLVLQGPYFIRRSIGSFLVDTIILILVSLLLLYILDSMRKRRGGYSI